MAKRDNRSLSRRVLVGGAPVAAIALAKPINAVTQPDPTCEACLRYVGMEDKVMSLLKEWPTLESGLAEKYPGFLGLPVEEQARFPGGARLLEIQDELDALDVERDKLLPVLVKLRCRSFGGCDREAHGNGTAHPPGGSSGSP